MSLKAKVAQGLKWQAVTIVGRQLLSLLVFTTLARLLDPSDFGLMGLTYVYLMLAGMLTDQGIGTALIQRANLQREHWDTAFWFNLGCATLLCLGTIALANPLASLLGEPRLAPLLQRAAATPARGAPALRARLRFPQRFVPRSRALLPFSKKPSFSRLKRSALGNTSRSA